MRPERVIQRTARAYLLRDVRRGGFERGVFRLRLEDAQKLRDGDACVEQRAELFAEQDDLFVGDRLLEEFLEAFALQGAVPTGNLGRHEAAAKQRLTRLFRAFGLNIAGERHAFVIDRPVGIRMFLVRHEYPFSIFARQGLPPCGLPTSRKSWEGRGAGEGEPLVPFMGVLQKGFPPPHHFFPDKDTQCENQLNSRWKTTRAP